MMTIPYACVAPANEDAGARRHALRRRMRIMSIIGTAALAGLAACVTYIYLQGGALAAIGALFIGGIVLFEAFRRADQRLIAPMQARCQDDYNRQVELILTPLFSLPDARTVEHVERFDT